ncbi:MAG: ATP synthase subunit I [Lachnospiraceae bacterium]|nr:ATP synthase subunit I [Lachnospiraceae bacterium]
MMIRVKLSELNETLLDLIIGILIYNVAIGVIGMIIKRSLYYLLGIIGGTVLAVITVFIMLYFIDGALDMDPKSANAYVLKGQMIRYGIMGLLSVLAIKIHFYTFAAGILALLGIKAAAHMQPFVNKYITKKITIPDE